MTPHHRLKRASHSDLGSSRYLGGKERFVWGGRATKPWQGLKSTRFANFKGEQDFNAFPWRKTGLSMKGAKGLEAFFRHIVGKGDGGRQHDRDALKSPALP